MTAAIEGGRVLDALRLSARPPEPALRLPAELAVSLAAAAGAAMTAELAADDWMALLMAVLESPVRRTVKPVGLPDSAETKESARQAAGAVPELAKLVGLRIPPRPAPDEPPPAGQRSERWRTSSRVLNPAASSSCLLERSPGNADRIDLGASARGEPVDECLDHRLRRPRPPGHRVRRRSTRSGRPGRCRGRSGPAAKPDHRVA